jgi:glycosyltransferase involved in cell wall biosynthesis
VISSRAEGGPYTLPEALLAGCPVVATRVGMVPDYLPDEHTCPTGDREGLAGLLRRALADPAHLRRQQEPLFRRAAAELTLEAMVERTRTYYREICYP